MALKAVTNLDVRGRQLKLETRADVAPLIDGLDPTVIEEIHLGGNTIGVDASKALAEFLEKTTVLRVADFADIFTGRLITEIPLALSALCDALKDKTSLVEINLSDNAFGGRSVDPMVPFLTHNRSFQILKLTNNGLGPAGGAAVADALLKSAQLSKEEGKKSNLRVVICGRNRLENGSASQWADAFAAHGTLVDVRMPQNGIRMDGITALAKGLSQCPDLETIDLQDNTFTEEGDETGVKAWAGALSSWASLHTLNLSDCVLSNEGEVPELVKALATGSSLKLVTLQLQNNNLQADTFELLANAISTHLSDLKTLELQWNDAEDEDEEHFDTIASALKARGGRLIVNDEDEEEEEEGEEVVEEEVEKPEEDVEEVTEVTSEKKPSAVDKTADALADLLNKVHIG
ncbi:RNI-like protein [Leucogyrophana mollusca]|uniref:RNI-like protein n=1 Tax=Leucogyrophana mollusca TaxID=85980 RepID=A0ACB8BQY7_9AGAM|nr:RNI-like protein [Leucogyrophana mollusca]